MKTIPDSRETNVVEPRLHPDAAAATYTAAGSGGFEQREITSNWELVVQNLIKYVPEWRTAVEGS